MRVVKLGDPHLGKQFLNGVPLHRRGEREKSQWFDFIGSLAEDCDLHVCMGDIFDKKIVPYEVILEAAQAYKDAAYLNSAQFIVIRGNHDASKDSLDKSAYDIFAAILEGTKNVHVLQNDPVCIEGHLFIPWQPHRPAADLVPGGNYSAVYGHWDVIDFGNENPNLIPINRLKDITGLVVTGHDHNARTLFDGLVHVTGSMQPYSFAEDAEGELYVTLNLDELEGRDLRDRCVRVVLRPGESVPDDLDCLQLTVKKLTEDQVEQVELGQFDMKAIFDQAMEGVSEGLQATCWEKMRQ
jgi:DNA repair exonuclease SbcCD nuclease subunit